MQRLWSMIAVELFEHGFLSWGGKVTSSVHRKPRSFLLLSTLNRLILGKKKSATWARCPDFPIASALRKALYYVMLFPLFFILSDELNSSLSPQPLSVYLLKF